MAVGIEIGDNVGIGQNFHITSASQLRIGSGTVISGNVLLPISIMNIEMSKFQLWIGDINKGNIDW